MKYVMMAAVVLLTACEKEHVCDCRTRANATATWDTTRHVLSGSLSSAENRCVAFEKELRSEDGKKLSECEIAKDNR